MIDRDAALMAFKNISNRQVIFSQVNENELIISNDQFILSTVGDWRFFSNNEVIFANQSNGCKDLADFLRNSFIKDLKIGIPNRTPVDLLIEFEKSNFLEIFSPTVIKPWLLEARDIFVEDGLVDNQDVIALYQNECIPVNYEILSVSRSENGFLLLEMRGFTLNIPCSWRIVNQQGLVFGCYDSEQLFFNKKSLLERNIVGFVFNQGRVRQDAALIFDNGIVVELFDCGEDGYEDLESKLNV